ncbi:MAG TPA: phosphate-starvation-inducible PsiE family protein [Chloroflexota bacterium]|jgi:phosphate starvation-inducible membrane PsiE
MNPAPLEPEVDARPGAAEQRLYRSFEQAETILTASVAIVLIALAMLALLDTFVRVIGPLLSDQHDAVRAVTDGIDAAFLVIILLELLHTILSHGPISQQLQEFLAIGITAAVRHGLGLAASSADQHGLVIDLAINSSGVLLLVLALWLVRQRGAVEQETQAQSPATTVATEHGH